jgi:hypothetical protein
MPWRRRAQPDGSLTGLQLNIGAPKFVAVARSLKRQTRFFVLRSTLAL